MDLLLGQDGGQAFWAAGAYIIERELEGKFEDGFVEKGYRVERLVLDGSGDIIDDGEVGEEGLKLGFSHFARMRAVVESYVAADPVKVLLFGPIGVVFSAQYISGFF